MRDASTITINAAAGLVTIEFFGHITAAHLRTHFAEVEALGPMVAPPFTVLADLTGLERMDPDCAPILSSVMDRLNEMGVSRVVRVIPDPRKDIGLGILSLFHYKSGVRTNTVPTRAEAVHLVA